MADVIFNRKDLQSFCDGKELSDRFQNYEDCGYLPIPLLLDFLEKRKKECSIIPSDLKKLLPKLKESDICMIEFSKGGLLSALADSDFGEKFVNRVGNPFEFASEASLYEYEDWWDRSELIDSLREITWA